jgi:hypothetical protein
MTHVNSVARGVQACTSFRSNDARTVVSEFPLNHHQSLRAGKPAVSISRWKIMPSGIRRASQALEFGAHRIWGGARPPDKGLFLARSRQPTLTSI